MIPTNDDFTPSSRPIFHAEAKQIWSILQSFDHRTLKNILKCNEQLVAQNYERYHSSELDNAQHTAIMSYQGLQFQHLGAHLLEERALNYLNTHLRILSGLYGVLKPLDEIVLYRLEMQTKIETITTKNLYDYWRDKLTPLFKEELIINLASKEYYEVLDQSIIDRMIHVHFKVKVNDRLITKGTLAKMARGAMVRYMAIHQIQETETLKLFNEQGFKFSEVDSTHNHYVFVRNCD